LEPEAAKSKAGKGAAAQPGVCAGSVRQKAAA